MSLTPIPSLPRSPRRTAAPRLSCWAHDFPLDLLAGHLIRAGLAVGVEIETGRPLHPGQRSLMGAAECLFRVVGHLGAPARLWARPIGSPRWSRRSLKLAVGRA